MAALKACKELKINCKKYNYLYSESDERRYNSPFVELGIGSIMRSKYHTSDYPEYHTSLDRIGSVVTSKGLNGSITLYKKIIQQFEKSFFPLSAKKCEPFMTKHKLYHTLNDKFDWKSNDVKKTRDIMNFISHCDQKHSIEEISKKLNLRLDYTKKIFIFLLKKKLIHV